MRVLPPRIIEETWESHRKTIHYLFITEGRGLEGVIDIMGKQHEFIASKSRYEARLRHWNIRKKITEREWNAILPRVQKRADRGRQTNVLFNGVVLGEERIERELARRRSNSNMRRESIEDADQPTPTGFAIQSPPHTAENMGDINMTFCNLGSPPVDGVELMIESTKTALPDSDTSEQMRLDDSLGQVELASSAPLYAVFRHGSDHMPAFTTDTHPVVVKKGILSSIFLSPLATSEELIS